MAPKVVKLVDEGVSYRRIAKHAQTTFQEKKLSGLTRLNLTFVTSMHAGWIALLMETPTL
ncbi:MAG TPA: hypothetical protein V6C86_00105 [Oculatellaceae cyanobacterium]